MDIRLTIVPLHFWHDGLYRDLPFTLDNDVSVENPAPQLSDIDLSLWSEFVSNQETQEIKRYSVCLVHRYPLSGNEQDAEADSRKLLQYVT